MSTTPTPPATVYQVRALTGKNTVRIVHAYASEDEAKAAIVMMKKKTGQRYTYVAVPNQPDEYWGINTSKN